MPNPTLEEIEKRAEKATAGPWYVTGTGNYRHRVVSRIDATRTGVICEVPLKYERSESEGNRAFIAHARADIPFLLAEVRRLRGALEKIEAYDGCGVSYEVGETDRQRWQVMILIAKQALTPQEGA